MGADSSCQLRHSQASLNPTSSHSGCRRNLYWTGLQNQQHVCKLLRLNTIFNKTFSLHHIFICVSACTQLGGLMHAFLTDTATTCTKWAWNVPACAGIFSPMSLISLPIPLCLHYYLFLVSRPIPSLNYFQPQPDSATVWLPLRLLSFLFFPLLHKTLLQLTKQRSQLLSR